MLNQNTDSHLIKKYFILELTQLLKHNYIHPCVNCHSTDLNKNTFNADILPLPNRHVHF